MGVSWGDLLLAHRSRWLDVILAERPVIDLSHEPDPAAAIAAAAPEVALVWTESSAGALAPELRDQLRSAAGRGTAVVIGVPPGEAGQRDVEELRRDLGDTMVVVQQLAAASLIGREPASESAVQMLICANVEAPAGNGAGIEPDVDAVPLISDYVAHLEQANAALREANVRLARERLGVHDSAAAAIEERRMKLVQRVQQLEAALETEKQVAFRNHELFLMARDALRAPRYRAVDKVRDLLFLIPGLRRFLDTRSRRLISSGDWRESADGRGDAGPPG